MYNYTNILIDVKNEALEQSQDNQESNPSFLPINDNLNFINKESSNENEVEVPSKEKKRKKDKKKISFQCSVENCEKIYTTVKNPKIRI